MPKLIFTPWKFHSQLLSVRGQFYPPPEYTGPDMRSPACATVSAWKLRGNLPHPVEATSLLTDAILHDDAAKNSVFSIRATYAAAFCRFVTLLVDSKIHGQRKTMFQRAVDLGLPASFVELRHEATHRDLPSLVVLRNAAQRSLEWLWGYYWEKLDGGGRGGSEVEDEDGVRDAVRGVLRLMREGDDEVGEGRKRKRGFKLQLDIAGQLSGLCGSCAKGKVVLARVLIDEGWLIAKDRRLGSSIGNALTRWERLLQMVVENQSSFLSVLTDEMVNEVAFTDTKDPKNSPFCEGLYMWLDRILTSSQWEPSRRLLSSSYILAVCDVNSNHWTELLKERIRDAGGSISSGEQGQQGRAPQLPPPMPDDGLKQYGWTFVDTWDSRPLGIVP